MSCANFHKVNARNYYVLMPTTTHLDENDNEVEAYKDDFDYQMDIECATEYGKNHGFVPVENGRHIQSMDAAPIMEKSEWFAFGKKSSMEDFNQIRVDREIFVRSGEYSGANFDWDIFVMTNFGWDFRLSNHDNVDQMVKNIADKWEEDATYYGDWNTGMASIQRKNFEKWLEKLIDKCSDEANEICRLVCEKEYACTGVLSNGEAMYHEVA